MFLHSYLSKQEFHVLVTLGQYMYMSVLYVMLNFGVYIIFPSEVIKKTIWETKKMLAFLKKETLIEIYQKN